MTCGSSTDRRSAPAGATALIGQKVCAACGWAAGFVCSTRLLRLAACAGDGAFVRLAACAWALAPVTAPSSASPPAPRRLRRCRRLCACAAVGACASSRFSAVNRHSWCPWAPARLGNHTRQRKIRTPDIVSCVFGVFVICVLILPYCILVPFLAILNGHLPYSPHTKS